MIGFERFIMSYADDLKHPKWQRKRLEIMRRDGWACTACHANDKTLHIHHKRYIAGHKPWEYADVDLSTFCEECHKLYHSVADHYANMQWQGKVAFWEKLLPDAEKLKTGPFMFLPSHKVDSGCIILHVPTGYWHEFSLLPSEALAMFESQPESRQELLELILKGVSAEWRE